MPKSARKSTPTKSRSPGKSNSKYEYVELNKASLSSADPVNFYGVITDATFPYKVTSNRFICSLRVVDPTTKGNTCQVVLYADESHRKFYSAPVGCAKRSS